MSGRFGRILLAVVLGASLFVGESPATEGDAHQVADVVVVRAYQGRSDPLAGTFERLGERVRTVFGHHILCRTHVPDLAESTPNRSVDARLRSTLAGLPDGTGPLVLYFVGHGETNRTGAFFAFPEDQKLSASSVDTVLDEWQQERGRDAVVVIDVCHAAAFAGALRSSPSARTVLSSCSADEYALFAVDGFFSYTEFLLAGVASGADILSAHQEARRMMYGWQKPGALNTGGKSWRAILARHPREAEPTRTRSWKSRGKTNRLFMPTYVAAVDGGLSHAEARHRALLVSRLFRQDFGETP